MAMIQRRGILLAAVALLVLVIALARLGAPDPRTTTPDRDVSARGAEAPDVSDEIPVGTEERPLDRVVVWLVRVSGRTTLTARAQVPVRLVDGETSAKIGGFMPGILISLLVEPGAERVIVRAPGFERRGTAMRLVPEGDGIRVAGWRYAGALVVRAREGRLLVTNDLPVEEYLAGVVPGEVPNSFAPEAQKALAVAARTYALVTRGRHPAAGTDLCDGPHCQNYLGILPWAPAGKAAVVATRGLLVWHGKTPIRTFYSAHCGGRSSNNEDVPLSDMPRRPLPYLRSVKDRPEGSGDEYCAASPHRSWTRELTAAQMEALLNRREPTRIGRLTGVRFVAFDVAGRVTRVRLEGLERPAPVDGRPFVGPPRPVAREVTGWEFRSSVGWRTMKSTLVQLKRPARDRYRFVGRGFGHGIGLCQIGANGMAGAPYHHAFPEILAHYYPGAVVAPLARFVGVAEPAIPPVTAAKVFPERAARGDDGAPRATHRVR
jgi:SpoIID/LytB domain protein